MINIDDLTIAQVKEIKNMLNSDIDKKTPFKIGENWLFRTVTHIDTGKIKAIHGNLITLEQAAWIADTGRFSDSLNDTSLFNEVEPYKNDCVINIDALIDATKIDALITSQV